MSAGRNVHRQFFKVKAKTKVSPDRSGKKKFYKSFVNSKYIPYLYNIKQNKIQTVKSAVTS